MDIKVCVLKLWLVLHFTAWTLLHPCSAVEPYIITKENGTISNYTIAQIASGNGAPAIAVSWDMQDKFRTEYFDRRYFYVHNETQIAMARAEVEAARRHDGGGASSTLSSVPQSGTFPDIPPSEDGCSYNSAERDLTFFGGDVWGLPGSDVIEILAVNYCAGRRSVNLGYDYLEFCSQRWVKPEKPEILIRDNPDSLTHSFKVLAKIRALEKLRGRLYEVLADGVYFPATGKMHLVGCTRKQRLLNFSASAPPMTDDFVMSSKVLLNVSYEVPPAAAELGFRPWIDPDTYNEPPLNSSTPEDCAISVTLEYPSLNSRWNTDRVLKYSIRSKRAKDDPLYFEPIERSGFFPYFRRYFDLHDQGDESIKWQRRLETGGRILLLVLGLVCVALQIEHGRNNEEALPFVSLVMLGIQLAKHLSQTSIFKDLQIGPYLRASGGDRIYYSTVAQNEIRFPDSVSEYKYYGTMAWSEHVPYQAMTMTSIFMFVWIFHRVGDRRRIMKLRVLRKRLNAKDPPSDWRVMYATLAFVSLLWFLGFFAIGIDKYGIIRRALTGMTAFQEHYNAYKPHRISEDALFPRFAPPSMEESPFVSWRFYELSQAHWSFVNNLTGLVVSFFLVPQMLGNMQWEVQGRPLSAWFYIGIPFLQSLPHAFSIAKHFQLLPIFPFFDPYINSIYGIYENPTPWWQIVVVVFSTLQVLAVHSQFSRSLIQGASRHSRPKSSAVLMAEMI